MHDIDQVALEDSGRLGAHETEDEDQLQFSGEYGEYGEDEDRLEFGGEYGEDETSGGGSEVELASELLEVAGEQELDRFLADLVRSASGAVHDFARTREGRQIGGILKQAAGRVLPVLGRAAGRAAGGALAGVTGGSRGSYRRTGARVGTSLGTLAKRCFGLELEGASGEDQEFEVARRFVRFARDAVRRCLAARGTGPAPQIARRAAVDAGRRWAPGLLSDRVLDATPLPRVPPSSGTGPSTTSTTATTSTCPRCSGPGRARRGRWERRGDTIVLHTS